MTVNDLIKMRTAVANVNVALERHESACERFFADPKPSRKAVLTRFHRNLKAVLADTRYLFKAQPGLWPQSAAATDNLEDAADSFTALLDMFEAIDPGVIEDEGEPMRLPDDEPLVQFEATLFVAAVERCSYV